MHSRVVHLAVAVVLGLSPTSIEAQAPPKAPAPRPAEDGDTISLIPTSIKETIVNLSHEGRSIEVPVQYSIRENTSQGRATLFVLPVWVVES
ncbi:MAG: hypothetical protein N2039_00845, partial [Gemmataceae bacterium]|nr:hypothetical protein [Gemmataceae bacterium]